MKYFSMFTGVGGFELGLPKEWECIGYSETDKYCNQLLEKKFPDIKNYGDCKKINPCKLPEFDMLCGGFPCQDVSLAGRRDLSNGRTMLINEVFRIIKDKQPKYVFLENVKGLLSMQELWQSIIWTFKKMGYHPLYKVLNSKDYGVPQNRERIFIIAKKGRWEFMSFDFPLKQNKVYLKNILEKNVDKKYYLSEHQVKKINDKNKVFNMKGNRIINDEQEYFSGLTCNLNHNDILKVHSLYPRSGNPKKGGIGHLSKEGDSTYALDTGNMQVLETSPTITGELSHQVGRVFTPNKFKEITGEFRRLTPIECERLQGFPDNWTEGFSDTQRYKMMGNAVTVNVIKAIGESFV